MGKRGTKIDEDIDSELDLLADPQLSMKPAEIMRQLEQQFPGRDLPDATTVQRRVKARREPQPLDQWDWREAPSEEAAIIQAELGTAIEMSKGRISSVSRRHAELIMKVKRAVPKMPTGAAWLFAYEYLLAKNTAHLDAALAVAATVAVQPSGELGLTDAQVAAHLNLHANKWLRRDFLAWAGSEETYVMYEKGATTKGDLAAIGRYNKTGIIRFAWQPGEKED